MSEKIDEKTLRIMEDNSPVVIPIEDMHKEIKGEGHRLCTKHTLEHATDWLKDPTIVSVEFQKLQRMTRYEAEEKKLFYHSNECEEQGCYAFPEFMIWISYPK